MKNSFSLDISRINRQQVVRILVCSFFLIVLSNCAAVNNQVEPELQDVDLSMSYAAKMFEQKKQQSIPVESKDPRAYYHFLMSLEAEKNYQFEKAALHYKEIVKYDPETASFAEKLVRLLLRTGQLDEAVKVGQKGLKRFPNNKHIHMDLADILAAQGKADASIYHYDKVSQIDPKNSRSIFLKGTVLEKQGRWGQAKDMYLQGSKMEHNNPLGQFYLGRAYLQNDELVEAEKRFQMSVVLKPNLLQARKYLAWVYERLGKHEEALKEYNLLLKLKRDNTFIKERAEKLKNQSSPAYKNEMAGFKGIPQELAKQPNVHMRIAAIYFEENLFMRALDEFQLVLAADDHKDPHVLMARIYENQGRLDKAIEEFEKLRKLEPESMDILRYSARLYHLDDNTKAAIELLQKAVEKEPKNDQIYHSLALAYMSRKENDKAVESLKKALALNPKKDSYYFELGALMEKTGDFKGAIENMRQAIEINPLHSNAHNFLGYIYALEGRDLDRALEHLKKALTIQPRNGYFLDSLGWIYFKKGHPEKALLQIQKALIYTDPDPVLYDHLGDILFSLKNYDEATGAWKNSRSLTLHQKDDLGGEMPNPKVLQEKIEKAKRLIQQSY
ncbi:MAG: tetratricopeptide repeat protein [Nitrospinae bacterium]|nr:tetratricopeptide repeat protein [Nitrospinota bacterium]